MGKKKKKNGKKKRGGKKRIKNLSGSISNLSKRSVLGKSYCNDRILITQFDKDILELNEQNWSLKQWDAIVYTSKLSVDELDNFVKNETNYKKSVNTHQSALRKGGNRQTHCPVIIQQDRAQLTELTRGVIQSRMWMTFTKQKCMINFMTRKNIEGSPIRLLGEIWKALKKLWNINRERKNWDGSVDIKDKMISAKQKTLKETDMFKPKK